jgi:hypothetical protein
METRSLILSSFRLVEGQAIALTIFDFCHKPAFAYILDRVKLLAAHFESLVDGGLDVIDVEVNDWPRL